MSMTSWFLKAWNPAFLYSITQNISKKQENLGYLVFFWKFGNHRVHNPFEFAFRFRIFETMKFRSYEITNFQNFKFSKAWNVYVSTCSIFETLKRSRFEKYDHFLYFYVACGPKCSRPASQPASQLSCKPQQACWLDLAKYFRNTAWI